MPNSRASSTASQPPISSRPRSFTRVAERIAAWASVGVRWRSCPWAQKDHGRDGVTGVRLQDRRAGAPGEIGGAGRARLSLWLPADGRRPRRSWSSARRRLVQGEPLRLRAGGTRQPGLPRSPSTSADTATATARWTAGRSTTCVAIATAAPTRSSATEAPIALRGSSMGGYLALVRAAADSRAGAVVAICPASASGLRRGLRDAGSSFDADVAALCDASWRARRAAAASPTRSTAPVLLLHAEGDEQVPVEHSRELAARARATGAG